MLIHLYKIEMINNGVIDDTYFVTSVLSANSRAFQKLLNKHFPMDCFDDEDSEPDDERIVSEIFLSSDFLDDLEYEDIYDFTSKSIQSWDVMKYKIIESYEEKLKLKEKASGCHKISKKKKK